MLWYQLLKQILFNSKVDSLGYQRTQHPTELLKDPRLLMDKIQLISWSAIKLQSFTALN